MWDSMEVVNPPINPSRLHRSAGGNLVSGGPPGPRPRIGINGTGRKRAFTPACEALIKARYKATYELSLDDLAAEFGTTYRSLGRIIKRSQPNYV